MSALGKVLDETIFQNRKNVVAQAALPAAPDPTAPRDDETPTDAGSAADAPKPGTGDDISARKEARLVALGLLVIGVVVALLIPEKSSGFKPAEGFGIFAGFYVVAQAIERLLELIPAGLGSKQAKADRAVIFPAIGFLLAVGLAELLGLFYVRAIGATDLSKNLDIIITALAIGGGTKPLHDGIKRIEKAKETPPTTT